MCSIYIHSLLKINQGSRTVFGIPRKIVTYFGATWNKVGTAFLIYIFKSALNSDRLLLFLLLLLFLSFFLSFFLLPYLKTQFNIKDTEFRSWAPVPNKPMGFVDVKQHFNH